MKTITTRLLAAAALCLLPVTADAAVTHIVKDGTLMGATGVTIGAKTYDVSFVDGTCADVFGTCETSKFDFDESNYGAAMLALLDQVLVDTADFKFDSTPERTNGCESLAQCVIFMPIYRGPFEKNADSLVTGYVYNSWEVSNDFVSTIAIDPAADTSLDKPSTFARFTLSGGNAPTSPAVSAVPEPATWALMLAGFGLTGAAMRRRRPAAIKALA